jgi:hypothetical protein
MRSFLILIYLALHAVTVVVNTEALLGNYITGETQNIA